LEWATNNSPSGCRINFQITNTLQRSASFGVVNLLTHTTNYLIINGQQVPFVNAPTTVLDAFGDAPYEIANPRTDGDLAPGDTATLAFTDAPSTKLGKGCWRSPSVTDGQYESIGYILSFQTFVLQDWDKANNPDIMQTPIGGSPVVEWAIQAQADLNPANKKWVVNSAVSSLLKAPASVPQPGNFAPAYQGYIQSGDFELGSYDTATDCYVFKNDPIY
jgi:hypothetical protein